MEKMKLDKEVLRDEVVNATMRLPGLAKLNFRIAGALADVNKLVANGWTDLTGAVEEGEYIRMGSAWLELVRKADGREIHVALSVGDTLTGKNEKGDGWKRADAAYALKAHRGGNPRIVFLRRLSVWVLDEKELSFKLGKGELPDGILADVERHLAEAIVEKPRLLLDDLAFQNKGYLPFADFCIESDVDVELLKTCSVLSELKKKNDRESAARILSPIARAVLTDEDPQGRDYLKGLSCPACLAFLADFADFAGSGDAMLAVMSLMVACSEDAVAKYFGLNAWRNIAIEALNRDLAQFAAYAVEGAVCQHDGKKEDVGLIVDVFWATHEFFKRDPQDAEACRCILDSLEDVKGELRKERDYRLLLAVARCYVADLAKIDSEPFVKNIGNLLGEYTDSFDEANKDEEKPWLQTLPQGVKAPLAWQSLLFCHLGASRLVLSTFPKPPLSTAEFFKYRPTEEPVEGLSFVDVWKGFLPEQLNEEIFKSRMEEWGKGHVQEGEDHKAKSYEWNGAPFSVDVFQVLVPEGQGENELMTMSVRAICGDEKRIVGLFPYLPKESESNSPNVKIKVWKYHPWDNFEAADAEFELEDGRRLTGVMPFYAADKGVVMRGAKCSARLVGFASELERKEPEKLPDPIKITEGYLAEEHGGPVDIGFCEEFFDFFDTDTFDERISHSGFGLHGRVTAVRKIKALGTDVLAVTVKCAKIESGDLDDSLEIFIGADHVKGGELAVGDVVEAYGWLYIDVHTIDESAEEFFADYPQCAPLPESDERSFGSPLFIRTEYSEEEKKQMPWAVEKQNDWVGFGKAALRGCKGVERVVYCGRNPQRIDYLVRQCGKIRKFAYVIAMKDDPVSMDNEGVETFVLRKEKAERGFKISWDGLPKDSDPKTDK